MRLSNRSRPKWTPPPPKSQNINVGIDVDGPISPSFVKATDYDEIPVGSPIAAAAALKMYEGKIPVKIPPTKITAMPVLVKTSPPTPLLRERHNMAARKTNMKLDIKNPNVPQSESGNNGLSKTDSLAMFLKYEKELTAKELKDKSNCISKQNLTKDNKLPDINATSQEKRVVEESTKENQSKSHSAPPMMKMNACDNLPALTSLQMSTNNNNLSESDKSRSPSVDRTVEGENESPNSTSKRGSGGLRRKMKYNLENMIYDTDPEVKSNHSSSDNSNHNSLERPISRMSNTESIFEDFDFDQFIASFNDDDKFPIFKDYKMMMNTKSKADEEMKISTLSTPASITKHDNITNCNTKNVVKSLNDSLPIPIQSPPSRKLPEDDALSGFEKLDNLCKMLAGNSDSDESNSLEADQNRSKSSADSAYGR